VNPADLEGVAADDVALQPLGDGGFDAFDPAHPVDLRSVDARGGTATLVQGRSRAGVRAVGRASARVLAQLAPADRRVCAFTLVAGRAANVRVWRFDRAVALVSEEIRVVLDEPVLQSVGQRLGNAVGAEDAIRWVEEAFLLPSAHEKCRSFVALLGGRTDGSALDHAFTLVGRDAALDVVQAGGRFVARRLSPPRQATSHLTTALVTARVACATEPGGEDGTLLASLLAGSNYMSRWSRYNEREYELEGEQAERVGRAEYTKAEAVNEAWRFDIAGSPDFVERVEPGMDLEAAGYDDGLDGRANRVTGAVQSTGDMWVDLLLLHDDATPPSAGTLSYALAGAAASYNRRLEAARQLATGAVPLPELAALLELRSMAPLRAEGRLRWRSPAVLAVFGGNEPTIAQRRAIEIALNTPDIAVIQGPPGTGKTKVIAAIAARLAEELGEVVASRQILLTSHQHDAVDNVAARTVVFGIPSTKESNRGDGSWIDTWRYDRIHHIRTLLDQVEQGDLAAARDRVEREHVSYLLAPREPSATARLLTEVDVRCGRYLPLALRTRLDGIADDLRRDARREPSDVPLVRAIRSIRVTAAGHEDDGPDNARLVLKRLGRLAEAEGVDAARFDLAALRAAADAPVLADELAQRVALVKDALLDHVAVRRVQTHTAAVRDDVARVLSDVVAALDDRLRADGLGMAAVLGRFVHDLTADPGAIEDAVASYAPVVAATCQGAANLATRLDVRRRTNGGQVATVIVDEAARATPLDLQIPMTLATRRVVLVGDQRQLPHTVDQDVASSVVAGETEAAELQESLFGRLFHFLGEERRRLGRPERSITLDEQFRMHPDLGRFVSEQFYEPYGEAVRSPLTAERFAHDLPRYEGRCAEWIDIGAGGGDAVREDDSRSLSRLAEARWIAKEVTRLMKAAPHLTFGIISFYSAQRDLILAELVQYQVGVPNPTRRRIEVASDWRFTEDEDGETVERLRVGTVDAFQGKEFDVVLLSAVRTPSRGQRRPDGAFGHLVVENRLCVSMSRQRRLLVVVGDKQRLLEHPLADDHIRPLVAFARLADEDRARRAVESSETGGASRTADP
jgi:hypothetical protein